MKWVFDKTLNNVWFGIVMMLLVGAYIAVGSGAPQVREFFEQDEMAFFQAWPFKVIMALLVMNLVTVTFMRIPFTVPRYGVWMIHAGIVTLIYGMAYYYALKEEGTALVFKGEAVSNYYDKWERSLYVRIDDKNTNDDHAVLRSLPRFKTHDIGTLKGSDLRGIEPVMYFAENGEQKVLPLRRVLGLEQPLTFDVVGYWPYARVLSEYESGVRGGATGVLAQVKDASGKIFKQTWLVSSEPGSGATMIGGYELEHREFTSDAAARELLDATVKIHQLEVTVGGKSETFGAEVGKTYEVAGYRLSITEFVPNFPAMNGEVVKLLTMNVVPPGGREPFKRQVISGREKITDWKQGVAGSGPMGKRMDAPLDPDLVTRYTFNDALDLLPHEDGGEKRIFVTSPEKTYMVATSASLPSLVLTLNENKADLTVGEGESKATLHFERQEGLVRHDRVQEVPKEKRDSRDGEAGIFQVIAVQARCGDYSELAYVPFAQWVGDFRTPWNGGKLHIPNVRHSVQLQLGQRIRPIAPDMKTGIPASVKLDDFKLRSYAGSTAQTMLQRDFMASLTITEGNGHERQGVAHMNSPVYFGTTPMFNVGDSYWTLFQASWDPQGQRFTILGVGNRPGIWIMTGGCILTVIGLMYAFYVKPLIIKARKNRAIAEAKAKGRKVPAEPVPA